MKFKIWYVSLCILCIVYCKSKFGEYYFDKINNVLTDTMSNTLGSDGQGGQAA